MADSVCWYCKYSRDGRLCGWVGGGKIPPGCKYEKAPVPPRAKYKHDYLISITDCPKFKVDSGYNHRARDTMSPLVVQMLPFENTVVKIHLSCRHAAEETGYDVARIYYAAKNGIFYKGYRWKYYGTKCKKIMVYRHEHDGKVNHYLTYTEAMRETGLTADQISRRLKHKQDGWSRFVITDKRGSEYE